MTQKSLLWQSPTSGDGAAGYTENEIRTFFHAIAGKINAGVLNGLTASGASSPVVIAAGESIVAGLFYWSDANVNVAVTTPSVGTTGHKIVLRADWAAKTTRITLLSSPDGTATLPAIIQNIGTTYDLELVNITITTGGVITLTDARIMARIPGKVTRADSQVIPGSAAGDRLLDMPARQGGSATAWQTAGSTDYSLATRVKVQAGTKNWSGGSATSGSLAVTLPDALAYAPMVFASANNGLADLNIYITGHSTTGFTINWQSASGFSYTSTDFSWLAIGQA